MREAATSVARRLREAGYEAVFAGGCVRDMLMGREPTDYDIATSALPEQVQGLFRRTQKVGAKFGVVLVKLGSHLIEVATFRTDLEYQDGRRPVGVVFASPEADALRRDFTINGMFLDPFSDAVIDYVGGRADIDARLVRAIGNPDARFAEDHLRLVRAVRFAARLTFDIEASTFAAIRRHAPEIARIAPERIRMELEKILAHESRARGVGLLMESGLAPYLWLGAAQAQPYAQTALPILAALPPAARFECALAAILLNAPVECVENCCDGLRCSNQVRSSVLWLHRHAEAADQPDQLSLAGLKRLMAAAEYQDWLHLFEARCKAVPGEEWRLKELSHRANQIAPDRVAPPPLLSGHDLAGLGLEPGPMYKKILDAVYEEQLNEQIETHEQAIARARDWLAEE